MTDDLFGRVLRPKAHLRPVTLEGERTFLLGENERFFVAGRPQAQLLALMDGRRTVGEVLQALEGQAFLPEVYFTLQQMLERGELVDATPELPPEVAAFWQAQGVAPREVVRRLAASPVAVEALDGLDAAPLAEALRALGLTVSPEASLRVALARDYLSPGLEALNRQALKAGTPWLLVKPVGATPWLGPFFRPGSGPCWQCLASRLRANRPVETFLHTRTGANELPPLASLPSSLQAALHLAASTLARHVVGASTDTLASTLLTLEFSGPRIAEHPVVRRPQCPACGQPELLRERASKPLVLEPRPKGFTEDGGHRIMTPEEAYERFRRHIDPITGAISSVGPLPESEPPLRLVYGATYYLPLINGTPNAGSFHTGAFGKGRTDAQCRMSALGEAIERWSALYQGDEPSVRARFSELGDAAVHPYRLLNFSETQYRERGQRNAGNHNTRAFILPPFDEEQPADWTPFWSLTHQRLRYLPSLFCYGRFPAPLEARFCEQDSNGNAAGSCLEEAVLQGFLELVERDAVAIWWYNCVRRPGVDLASFGDRYFDELPVHYRSLGWDLWVLDLTHDLEIPVFVALGRSEKEQRWCCGFGSHLEARIGIQRALTEFTQCFGPSRRESAFQSEQLRDDSFLAADPAVPPRTAASYPPPPEGPVSEDVRVCVARAARVGLETLVLDQTRPDVGLCAVKVAVPGLRHFWPRLGPGRLYDVPVRLGWRSTPLKESELNPVHLFL